MKKLFVITLTIILFSQILPAHEIAEDDTIRNYKLEEIVIKSPKELPLIREIPGSISLLSERQLANTETHTLADISSTVPNLFMLDYGSKLQTSVFMRGVGSRLGTPSIGLYVDNVPYFEKATFGFDFFDIERIEVLRGPQGTLYGRNTMGGIINVFSKSPLVYDETNILATAGNYGNYSVNINHYNKINNNLGYSISGNYLNHNGYFINEFTGNPADKQYSAGGRGRLIWRLSDKLTLENIASFEISKQFGFPYALYNDSTNQTESVNYDQESYYDRDLFSNGFVVKYQNEAFEFISTTSYQYYDGLMSVDQDFTKNKIYFFEIGDKQNMFSQEFVLKSLPASRYKWLFGTFGFYQSLYQETNGSIYAQKLKQEILSDFKISGIAFYHQSSYDDFLIKNLSVTAGVRLDMEKDVLDYIFNQAVGDAPLSNLVSENYSENFMQFIPKGALRYSLNKSSNIYTTVSKGYKSGGFNTNTSIVLTEDRAYDAEQSWNYEFGFKSSLLNNRLFIDAAVFYIDWNNQQIYQTVPSGTGSMLTNAGKSESKGVEFEIKALPAKNLEIWLASGYNKATFVEYVKDNKTDYSGNYIPYVPRFSVSTGANYLIEVNKNWLDNIRMQLTYNGFGKHFWNEDNVAYQDYYGLMNFRAGFERKNITLSFWGKNIFNTDYNSFYFNALGKSYAQIGKPALIGANVKIMF